MRARGGLFVCVCACVSVCLCLCLCVCVCESTPHCSWTALWQAEVKKYEGFVEIMTAMKSEVDASEAKLAEENSPKKAHKSKRNK